MSNWRRSSNIHCLRATCRRFRILSGYLNFWKSDYFSLERLVYSSSFNDSDEVSLFNERALNILRCLIQDRVLYEALG